MPLFDEEGALLDILDVCAATGLALASGHIHVSETRKVFAEAKKRSVERLIFTHPEDIVGASMEDTLELAKRGAQMEHSLAFFVGGSKFRNRSNEELKAYMDFAVVDREHAPIGLGEMDMLSLAVAREGRHAFRLRLGPGDAAQIRLRHDGGRARLNALQKGHGGGSVAL